MNGTNGMNNGMNRRRFAQIVAATGALPFGAWAQDVYPNRPLKLVVPLPAGGAADVNARTLAARLQQQLGQPVVVENKPGGSFVIGMQAIGTAPADGHSMIAINTGMVAAQLTLGRINLLESLTPVSTTGTTPCQLVVPASSPFRTPGELVEYGRRNPGKLNYGSVGVGTLEHLWCTLFGRTMGFEATHVPFKGMPDAITALVQGELHFIPSVFSISNPHVQRGNLRCLAILSDKRHDNAPDTPTLKEQGVNVRPMEFWGGLAVAKGTPPALVERLRKEINLGLQDRSVTEKLRTFGSTPVGSVSVEAFTALIQSDIQWMTQVIRDGNMKFS
ncbi:MAG TPA: tripartite tricarboxylate transporter substrate binding protein [Burkholderiaceae bacterium]|nr:tripartite tricarboxylate transporter substrate binding protein [Burkholderiaceae bacterium]